MPNLICIKARRSTRSSVGRCALCFLHVPEPGPQFRERLPTLRQGRTLSACRSTARSVTVRIWSIRAPARFRKLKTLRTIADRPVRIFCFPYFADGRARLSLKLRRGKRRRPCFLSGPGEAGIPSIALPWVRGAERRKTQGSARPPWAAGEAARYAGEAHRLSGERGTLPGAPLAASRLRPKAEDTGPGSALPGTRPRGQSQSSELLAEGS